MPEFRKFPGLTEDGLYPVLPPTRERGPVSHLPSAGEVLASPAATGYEQRARGDFAALTGERTDADLQESPRGSRPIDN